MKKISVIALFIGAFSLVQAQEPVNPIHTNIFVEDGKYVLKHEGKTYHEEQIEPYFTLSELEGINIVQGTEEGLSFSFPERLNGLLYYGFIPEKNVRYRQPVFFKQYAEIADGKAVIKIKGNLEGKYDMINWSEKGIGTLGVRIENADGIILHDSKIPFEGMGPFVLDTGIIEGPFIAQIFHDKAVIRFSTNFKCSASILCNGKSYSFYNEDQVHEITVDGLKAETEYDYAIEIGNRVEHYSFKTAPKPGTRKKFTFAYASDSRNGNGGGERNIYGANSYIIKKLVALAAYENSAFMQFSGDLIDGYLTSADEMNLQYSNWKNTVAPFAAYMPVVAGMGNHEALMRVFNDGSNYGVQVDRFPYETESAEKIFADNFCNPLNGPDSENSFN